MASTCSGSNHSYSKNECFAFIDETDDDDIINELLGVRYFFVRRINI